MVEYCIKTWKAMERYCDNIRGLRVLFDHNNKQSELKAWRKWKAVLQWLVGLSFSCL